MASAAKASPAAAYRKVLLEHEDPLDDPNDAEFVGATLSITPDSDSSAPATNPIQNPNSAADPNANLETDGLMANNASENEKRQGNENSARLSATSNENDSKDYFAVRSGAFEQAVEICKPIALENLDGQFRGAWLLTEIDHWDNEKERLVFLLDLSIIVIKFDFITLRILDYRRIRISEMNQLSYGQIKYPHSSLMPKLNGALGHVKQFMTSRSQRNESFLDESPPSSSANPSQCSGSESSPRNSLGVRAWWNKGQPLQFAKNWNPWSREIPFITLTAHRMHYTSGVPPEDAKHYNIKDFKDSFLQAIQLLGIQTCLIKEEPIVIENYLGLVSAFHNITDLGFFKARGRISF